MLNHMKKRWNYCGAFFNSTGALYNPTFFPQKQLRGSRYASVSGSLKPGYYVDFIVIDRDILSIPHEEIKNVRVCATWVGGKLVYASIKAT